LISEEQNITGKSDDTISGGNGTVDKLKGPERLGSLAGSELALLARRAVAGFIDALIVATLSATTVLILQAVSGHLNSGDNWLVCCSIAFVIGFIDVSFACGALLIAAAIFGGFSEIVTSYVLAPVVPLVLNHLYHGLFESSPEKATFGKKLLNLRITAASGESLNFNAALLRNASKALTLSAFLMPFIHLVAGNRRQLIHDRIAGAYIELNQNSVDDKTLAQSAAVPLKIDKTICAGIGRRAVASLLDSFLYFTVVQFTLSFLMVALAHCLARFDFMADVYIIVTLYLLASFFTTSLTLSVFAACEASGWQATPGKLVAGIKVLGEDGGKITFLQALAKQLKQGLAYCSLYPLFAMVSVPAIISPELAPVLGPTGYVLFYLCYGMILCLSFKNGQTLMDRVCQRYVVREIAPPGTTNSIAANISAPAPRWE